MDYNLHASPDIQNLIQQCDNLRHRRAHHLLHNLGAADMILPPADYERDLRRELEFHVELLALDYERSGLSAAEARRHALIAFGGLEPIKEDCRDARRFTGLLRASRLLFATVRGH